MEHRTGYAVATSAHLHEVREFLRQDDAKLVMLEEVVPWLDAAREGGHHAVRFQGLRQGQEPETAAVTLRAPRDPLPDSPAEVAAERDGRNCCLHLKRPQWSVLAAG
jgi:hypothetical protein